MSEMGGGGGHFCSYYALKYFTHQIVIMIQINRDLFCIQNICPAGRMTKTTIKYQVKLRCSKAQIQSKKKKKLPSRAKT